MKMAAPLQYWSLIAIVIIWSLAAVSYAQDRRPLQDFCVAVNESMPHVIVSGKICKDPETVVADDFFASGLNIPGNISNLVGSWQTPVTVDSLAGLNTLGTSLVRTDYAPYGINPPHINPRGSEILVVLEGTLEVGFVSSDPIDPNQRNKLFTKKLHPGDVYVFPEGLIHYQLNIGRRNAVALSAFSSESPGVLTIANAVFGSDPPINPYVLQKAFQVDKDVIKYLQAQFRTNN